MVTVRGVECAHALANEGIRSAASGQPRLARFASETVTIPKQEYIELKAQAQFYKAQHERGAKREAALKQRIEQLQARNRDLQQRLFGRRSEKRGPGGEQQQGQDDCPGRGVRGQRRGSPGHGRISLAHLPVIEQEHDLSEEQKRCPECGEPLVESGLTQASEIIEFQLISYRRRVKRKRYLPGCRCGKLPGIVTAGAPSRLIPKGKLGISVWVEVLLDKYHYCRATNRLVQSWASLGLHVSQGTLIGGLKRLMPLFVPLMQAFKAQQLIDGFFHADETLWRVFEKLAGKVGYRWYLWVFRSRSVCFFVLDPSRAAAVPLAHFAQLLAEAIVVCDRYSAYKKMARTLGLLLAFCWAHVRRDFLELARGYPQLEPWAMQWVERIGTLYHLNGLRLTAQQEHADFPQGHARLSEHLGQMLLERDRGLADRQLHPQARKLLQSLQRHWQGLTVFLEHPEVPLDNNSAEQAVRNPVCARKNYFGSGAKWAGEFAAMMFTVFLTLVHCWQINPRLWLHAYLQACADNGGRAPPDLSVFLPWVMSPARLAYLRGPALSAQPAR